MKQGRFGQKSVVPKDLQGLHPASSGEPDLEPGIGLPEVMQLRRKRDVVPQCFGERGRGLPGLGLHFFEVVL
jgi:hypothetical protein